MLHERLSTLRIKGNSTIILKRPRITFWSQLYHHQIAEKLFREAQFRLEVLSDEL
jgi:hypothetical protein